MSRKGVITTLAAKEMELPQQEESLKSKLRIAYANEEITARQILEVQFAKNFINAGGKFNYSATHKELIDDLHALCIDNRWKHIYCLENELKDVFVEHQFKRSLRDIPLDKSNAGIMFCEWLIADNGMIMLAPKQSACSRLPIFPDSLIIVAKPNQMARNIYDALDNFDTLYDGDLPSVIDLDKRFKHYEDNISQVVLDATNTKNVYLFMTDEVI